MCWTFLSLSSELDIIAFGVLKCYTLETEVGYLEFIIHHQSLFNLMSEISHNLKNIYEMNHTHTKSPNTQTKVATMKRLRGVGWKSRHGF